jgi:hypothetical protein
MSFLVIKKASDRVDKATEQSWMCECYSTEEFIVTCPMFRKWTNVFFRGRGSWAYILLKSVYFDLASIGLIYLTTNKILLLSTISYKISAI